MDVEKMKVSELKAALAEKSLDTKGNKAALIERLQAATNGTEGNVNVDDNSNKDNEIVDDKIEGESNVMKEITEKQNEEMGEADSEVKNLAGDQNGSAPAPVSFEDQQFVSKKPSGISFELHNPTPVKPQPKELVPPDQNTDAEEASSRSGAAAYFTEDVAGVDPGTGEAVVPLPPSTGYGLDESEDEDDDGPPGIGTVKLPAEVTKVLVRKIYN